MDPQTLPAAEQVIYQKIKNEYQVAFEPLKLGAVRLNLLQVTDLEPLLEGKDPFKNVADFPF
ncbi:MAG TPA: methyltransferase, partial [Desulfobacteraceae bacterium]|nr:methyltransferase [Desulfobacteraceae bacterium]